MRSVVRAGVLFAVLFVAAAVSLGDLLGSFADPDQAFVDRFADDGNRIRDIVGSYLLVLAGLAFVWFALALSREAEDHRAPLLVTAALTAGGMILAGVALAAVPWSISFGELVDDPGLQQGQAVLPQFGYVALALGAMAPAAAFVVIVARAPGLLPRWLSGISYPVALLLLLAVFIFFPLLIFPAWIFAVTVTLWRA